MSSYLIGTMEYELTKQSNSEQRFNHHDCGDRKGRMYVRFNGSGFVWHCHNCSDRGYIKTLMSADECLERINNVNIRADADNCSISLPGDYVRAIPQQQQRWLVKYGITKEEQKKYRIGYSKEMNRIILPIFDGDRLVCWQGRGENPKYIGKGKKELIKFIGKDRNDIVVLVEDLLSAVKVARYCDAVPLLGSYIDKEKLLQLVRGYSKVFVWLDFDKATYSLQMTRDLSTLVPVTSVITKGDPKEYDYDDFIRHLA